MFSLGSSYATPPYFIPSSSVFFTIRTPFRFKIAFYPIQFERMKVKMGRIYPPENVDTYTYCILYFFGTLIQILIYLYYSHVFFCLSLLVGVAWVRHTKHPLSYPHSDTSSNRRYHTCIHTFPFTLQTIFPLPLFLP